MTTKKDLKKVLAHLIEPKVEKILKKDKTTNSEADNIDYGKS